MPTGTDREHPRAGPDRPAVEALLRHFDERRRWMPWRETSDPYAIWVSEVMLQQTRVETVIPYWERWMACYPTVTELADAELDDVLKQWEGLGYYSRARNLHSAARLVRERFGGELPRDPEGLRELPGVGEYTAGAVASIAYGVAVPAVDGNVRRVLARVFDREDPTPAELRGLARALVPEDRPGDFNQALMELGSTICTPRSPDCGSCPWASACLARRLGVQEERPRPKRGRPIPEEEVDTAVLVRPDGAVLLVRRPEDGLLGGLWEFPGDVRPEGVDRVVAMAGRPDPLPPVIHVFSHKRVTYRPVLYLVDEEVADVIPGGDGVRWVGPREIGELALPVAQQKIGAAARGRLADPRRGGRRRGGPRLSR